MEVIKLSTERKEPPPRTSSWKCWCKTPAEAAEGRVGILSAGEGGPPARSVPWPRPGLHGTEVGQMVCAGPGGSF